ncbi:MAG: sensor histidine kinase [Spirochaetes bacterium]|nr:sensor histidine kinase [Spirochaetota bacterium]
MEDLSLHILDIVENSTMAGATMVEIRIEEDGTNDMLMLTVKDNGAGMDGKTSKAVRDPFTTSRKTRRVGLGIPLLEQSAREAGGGIVIDSEPGKGTTITASFGLSHIDRRPLGDLASTIITLIMGNPGIDFLVHVDAAGLSAELDTREVRSTLGETPITHPRVLETIRGLFEG